MKAGSFLSAYREGTADCPVPQKKMLMLMRFVLYMGLSAVVSHHEFRVRSTLLGSSLLKQIAVQRTLMSFYVIY